MAELKCVESGCSRDAQYIEGGYSYCQEHYQAERQERLSARWVYVIGLFLWFGIWGLIYAGVKLDNPLLGKILFAYLDHMGLLWIPIIIGALVLGINLWLWWSPQRYASYQTEVEVIEFVERNSSWFLIASGTFLTAASFFLTRAGTPSSTPHPGILTFLFFEGASLMFLLLVVMLYWIPYQPFPKNLARLRHFKTIPFTYAVSFFAAAFIALVLAATSK